MEKRLTRNTQGKMIAGVAAGLADYLGIDATVMRLLFVLATFFHGSGLLVYIILWAVMPQRRDSPPSGAAVPPSAVPGDAARSFEPPAGSSDNRSAAVIGWILVALGVFFLMDEFLYPWFRDLFYWFNIRRVWPIIFVIVGILIISSANKKKTGNVPDGYPPPPVDDAGRQHQSGPGDRAAAPPPSQPGDPSGAPEGHPDPGHSQGQEDFQAPDESRSRPQDPRHAGGFEFPKDPADSQDPAGPERPGGPEHPERPRS